MIRTGALWLACFVVCAAAVAAQIEIPLTVVERAGVAREGKHVNAGIPLPRGAVADVGKLGLFTANGTPVPAAFVVRQKWLEDGSARWVSVHFVTAAPAKGEVKYVVKDIPGTAPAYPIKAEAAPDKITVDTGAVKFTVVKDKFNVLDEVRFDATGKGKYEKAVVEPGTAGAERGSSPAWWASPWRRGSSSARCCR